MSFRSLTTLFVLPVGNTLPTTGSTEDLTAAQFGVYLPDYTVATTGNIAAAKYIYLAQARKENTPGLSTKRSDKIDKTKIKKWYKIVSEPDVPTQSTVLSNWSVSCGEDISVTIRLHSNYVDAGFFNGRTQSVTVKAPCCDCGGSPCEDISAADTEALVDAIIAKFKQNPITTAYLDFYKLGSGATTQLVVIGKPLAPDGTICGDIAINPYWYDRAWFRVFAYKGADTTADFLVFDRCDQVADVAVTARALYPTGSSAQIFHEEKRYYSYQTSAFKHLFRMTGYNGAFETYVVDGQYYDQYYLEFVPQDVDYNWGDFVPQDAAVLLAVPTGQTTTLETLLTTYLGAPENKSAANVTTTTTTSTTSTTTTSTTTLQP
jgi:hypothetical protein